MPAEAIETSKSDRTLTIERNKSYKVVFPTNDEQGHFISIDLTGDFIAKAIVARAIGEFATPQSSSLLEILQDKTV